MTPVHRPPTRKAFTLLEMLVVIGIITLLAAILVPVISQVRMRAFVAQTQGEMQRIQAACQTYYHDFNAYPGPLAESMIVNGTTNLDSAIMADPTVSPGPKDFHSDKITSSENLVLGLLGLLSPVPGATFPYYAPPPPKHDVMSLNYARPASYHYLDFLPDELPTPVGLDYVAYGASATLNPPAIFTTDYNPGANPPNSETVSDSGVPEFMDHIPNPMPILYMRARPGATGIASNDGSDPNSAGDKTKYSAYNYSQLAPYGFKNIKTEDFKPPQGVTEPASATGWWTYFMNPGIVNEPVGKNAFVLIDAGPDRLFGTKDDIIVTP